MGDTVELSGESGTPPDSRLSYPVSASALSFQVRSQQQEAMLTMYTTSDVHSFTILLSSDMSAVTEHGRNLKRVRTPDLLSAEEWRAFWVAWHGGRVRVGRAGDPAPFLAVDRTERTQIRFVLPAGVQTIAEWKLELGPERPQSIVQKVASGEPFWVAATNGVLPNGALIGGHEEEPLYVIRASHNGSVMPGKFVPSEGVGCIAWSGHVQHKEEFEALVGCNAEWVAASWGTVPVGALPSGHVEDTQEILYVGRALHDGHLLVGQVQRSQRVLYVPYQGMEIHMTDYEVLVSGLPKHPSALRFEELPPPRLPIVRRCCRPR